MEEKIVYGKLTSPIYSELRIRDGQGIVHRWDEMNRELSLRFLNVDSINNLIRSLECLKKDMEAQQNEN